MKPLMRRVFVVLISLLTLGMYVPSTQIDTDAAEKKAVSENATIASKEDQLTEEDMDLDPQLPEQPVTTDEWIEEITNEAKKQTMAKMGPRIINKVDENMTETILPKIEEVMEDILLSADTEAVPYYEITEEPAPGYGEKIFNIYNKQTQEEIARFHVRRDKRPSEGYWFNFHYHLQEDNFTKHHEIGEVYWEKNTPPKWMS
jgi:hypothetical protein